MTDQSDAENDAKSTSYHRLSNEVRAIMWLLLVLGALACGAAIALHYVQGPSSQTIEITTTRKGAVTQKETTVSSGPDGAFLGSLLGVGVVVMLSGSSFHASPRFLGPGWSIELQQQALEAVDKVAKKQGKKPTPEEKRAAAAAAVG